MSQPLGNVAATLAVGVNPADAKAGLASLRDEIKAFKAELADLHKAMAPPNLRRELDETRSSLQRMQAEVDRINQQIRSGATQTAQAVSDAHTKSGKKIIDTEKTIQRELTEAAKKGARDREQVEETSARRRAAQSRSGRLADGSRVSLSTTITPETAEGLLREAEALKQREDINKNLMRQLRQGHKEWEAELGRRRKLQETQNRIDSEFNRAQANIAAARQAVLAQQQQLNLAGERQMQLREVQRLRSLSEGRGFTRYSSGILTPEQAEAFRQSGRYQRDFSLALAENESRAAKLASTTQTLASATRTHSSSAKLAAEQTQRHTKMLNDAHSAARGLASGFGAMWLTWGNIGPLLAGAALSNTFMKAAKYGGEFAYQLTFVKALGEESAEAMERLSDRTLKLAKDSLYGPIELANGLRMLAQAGLSADQAMQALPHVTRLATVGELSMAEAGTTLAGVMNAFKLQVGDFEHIGDVFAKAAALSQTSVQSMTQSMRMASVVGEQYNVSMEDTATALTLLAKINIVGTAAGTSLRNMLKELYSPADNVVRAMKRLGLETSDAQGNLRPFVDVIYDLKGKLSEYNKASQVKILQNLFGERGAKEAVAMLSLTREEWDKLNQSIRDSGGFMKDVSGQLEKTFKGEWKQALNTLQVQLIKAFKDAEPTLVRMTEALKETFNSDGFRNGVSSLLSGISTVTRLAVENLGVIVNLTKAYIAFKVASWGLTALQSVTATVLSLSGAMGPAISLTKALRVAVAGLFTPIGLISGGLALGTLAWSMWGDSGESAARRIKSALDETKDSAKAVLERLADRERFGEGDRGTLNKRREELERNIDIFRQNPASSGLLKSARDELEQVQEALDAMDKKEAELSNGLKSFNNPKGAGGGKTWGLDDRDHDRQLSAQAQAALNAYKHQEKLAKQEYDLQVHFANKKLEIGTLTDDQFYKARENALNEYNKRVTTAKSEADKTLKTLADASERKSVGQRISQMSQDIDNRLTEQREGDAIDQRRRLGDQRIDIEGLALAIKSKQIPALEAREALERRQVVTARELKELSAVEAAGVLARSQTYARYNEEISKAQASYELLRIQGREGTDEAKALKQAIDQLRSSMLLQGDAARSAAEENEKYNRSFHAGSQAFFTSYVDNATNAANQAQQIWGTSTRAMEDGLMRLFTTGKFGWREFASEVVKQIMRIYIAKMIAGMLTGGQSMWANWRAGSAGSGGVNNTGFAQADALGGAYGSSGRLQAFAKGGAFTNAIVSSPTLFKFAKGGAWGLGVMGEAGDEAVMPLARDAQGRLGVRAQGAGGGGDHYSITIMTNVETGQTEQKGDAGQRGNALGKQLEQAVRRVIVDEQRNGGLLAKSR